MSSGTSKTALKMYKNEFKGFKKVTKDVAIRDETQGLVGDVNLNAHSSNSYRRHQFRDMSALYSSRRKCQAPIPITPGTDILESKTLYNIPEVPDDTKSQLTQRFKLSEPSHGKITTSAQKRNNILAIRKTFRQQTAEKHK